MAGRRIAVRLMCLVAVTAVSACGQSSTSDLVEASAAKSVSPSPSPSPSPSKVAGQLSLVALGDSVPGGLGCESPCSTYPVPLGDLASRALGKSVVVTNLADNDSFTSVALLSRLSLVPEYVSAVTDADIVVVQIGANDWQGPCFWINNTAPACFRAGQKVVRSNLGQILDRVHELRGNKPTALRVVTYYNAQIGSSSAAAEWAVPVGEETEFQAYYQKALAEFNDVICAVAKEKKAICVDLVKPFNGAGGKKAAASLIGYTVHPSESGHALIAATIAKAGFAPLE